MRSVLGVHWKDWCWSWNSNTLATWCGKLTHLKWLCCWERLRAGGEGDNRGWDGWMASPTQWTWVCVDSGSWWWTGRPGVLRFMGLQRVEHSWAAELNWTDEKDTIVTNYKMTVQWNRLSFKMDDYAILAYDTWNKKYQHLNYTVYSYVKYLTICISPKKKFIK